MTATVLKNLTTKVYDWFSVPLVSIADLVKNLFCVVAAKNKQTITPTPPEVANADVWKKLLRIKSAPDLTDLY